MAIPDFQSIMLPLLKYAADGKEHTLREAIEVLSKQFGLTEAEKKELLASGRQPIIDNRIGWTRTFLKKAGLLRDPKRGVFQITDLGRQILESNPERIDVRFLKKFESFREFSKARPKENTPEAEPVDSNSNPEEALETAYQNLRDELATEILQQLKESAPSFFERTVVALLVRMGYGGSLKDAGKAIGQSGDEGIDGIIKEDRLGLDIIYVQAKRWKENNTIGRGEIQKFAGALQGQRARKGVFITTSTFTRDARDYASKIESKIVLIDGDELAQYMIDNNVGVTPVSSYEVKRIDTDFFSEQ